MAPKTSISCAQIRATSDHPQRRAEDAGNADRKSGVLVRIAETTDSMTSPFSFKIELISSATASSMSF
jgi:hypothetical protein